MARPGRVWPSSVLSPLCRAASETPASARGAEATRGLGLPGAAARPARASGAAGAARPPRVCVRAPAVKRGRPRPGLRAHGPARGPGTRALGTRAPRDRPLALRGQRQSDPAVRAAFWPSDLSTPPGHSEGARQQTQRLVSWSPGLSLTSRCRVCSSSSSFQIFHR